MARFAAWDGEDEAGYHYHFTPQALERARQQGLKVAQLLGLLKKHNHGPLPPTLVTALERWEQHGSEAHLEKVLLLRVSRPEILAELRKVRASRFLGEEISPTVVLLRRAAPKRFCRRWQSWATWASRVLERMYNQNRRDNRQIPCYSISYSLEVLMTDRLDWIQQELDGLKEAGLYNRIRTLSSPQGAWLVVDGKRVLNFCSNNYLGLANHPRLVKAAQEAVGRIRRRPGGGALHRRHDGPAPGAGTPAGSLQRRRGRHHLPIRLHRQPGHHPGAGRQRRCHLLG